MGKSNNKEEKKKSYAIASDNIYSHHILGTIFEQIRVYALEDNSPLWSKLTPFKKGFGKLVINNNNSVEFYLNKNNKYNENDWYFVFATISVYLGLGLYKKYKNNVNNTYTKISTFLFAIAYCKNTLYIDLLPNEWIDYMKIESEISLKNEDSISEQLKDNKKIFDLAKNISLINNYIEEPISFNESKINNLYSTVKDFEDIFIENLISQAQRTISLRTSNNLNETEIAKSKTLSYKAKKWFEHHYPLLASLSASFDIIEDITVCKNLGIEIGAVSAINKTIYINPLAQLNEMGMRFVIAHEILHIALNHAERRSGRDPLIWNLACDFVINHWLVEMNVGICPERLFLDKNLANKSADEIYLMIASDVRLKKKMTTLKNTKAGESNNPKSCDILDQDPNYFADFADACKEALLRGMFSHQSSGRGDLPADLEEEIKIINQPVIPWQVQLSQWISERFPLDENRRTYARPSRRQSSSPDIIRPAYKKPEYDKKTRTYGVIIDTSGSMNKELLGKCLGAIASYSLAQEVKEVRLVYCDAQPYDEGFVPLELLINKVKMKGRGGTVLQQAVNYLENALDFPQDAPILILTDGFFEETLTVSRDHAFLVPKRGYMPIRAKNVFEFK